MKTKLKWEKVEGFTAWELKISDKLTINVGRKCGNHGQPYLLVVTLNEVHSVIGTYTRHTTARLAGERWLRRLQNDIGKVAEVTG
jgi:hypothetical protein